MPDNLGSLIWTLCYTAVLLGVSLYGLHRYVIVYLFLKNKRNAPKPAGQLEKLPRVTPVLHEATHGPVPQVTALEVQQEVH